ncbi:MAG: ABC transporter ATP-binding protein [Deltaproteobacteria bacterium]|nr:ABC transporter ATP-binding protein [Deltaproteobacteria bacterium]
MAVKVEVRAVSKDYLIPVLDRISFSVAEGEFLCILGPNGCGKTTLLRIIGCMEEPTAGEVLIEGKPLDFAHLPEHRIGFVFQEDRLLPWKTLRENVALVLKPLGGEGERGRKVATDYLRFVGLAGFEDYFPNRVSGGMRQRAAIARALAVEPEILLMDEPFGGLDAQNRRIMQGEVQRIWRETKKTILFVTHSIEEATLIGTKLVMMSARPAAVREIIENDGGADRHAIVERLNRMITEEVIRQQGLDYGFGGATPGERPMGAG